MRRITRAALLYLTVSAIAPQALAAPQSTPGMAGPLAANPDPYSFNAGPLGDIYVTGAVSGLGLWQGNATAADDDALADLSNGQIFIQKSDGPMQFYLQAGGYSLPSLGTAYLHMDDSVDDLFGLVPVAYAKFAPTDNFSIQAGKLYTLIGGENTFTFQNVNIERGLLWNQTNAVNRGVQVNYAQGPVSGSVAWSDGFYSSEFNWLSGLVTYTMDPANSLTMIASGSLKSDSESSLATPLFQNNSQIYDILYTHTSGPWTMTPALQYTYVPQDAGIGIADAGSTLGAALTTKYTFNDHWSLGGRVEYIDSTGSINLMYGPGSSAWSATLTPTYQQGIFFARGEASYVDANDTTAGSAFGSAGNDTSQGRLLVEAGVLF